MQLLIEKWANENKIFDEAAAKSFNEAVMCYKVGAYQSAFIMSYLSFKLTIKHRIITFDNNSLHSFDDSRWNKIIDELKNEDHWEEKINLEVSNKKSGIIKFTNVDRMVSDYTYWKNIRNSCVHAKTQTIDASTVECFWNYLKDNLSKFYVLGGHDYIRKKILNYFKDFRIDKNFEDLNKILYDISVLYLNDEDIFFSDIEKDFKDNNINLFDDYNIDIWEYILNYPNPKIKEGFIKHIANREDLILKLYAYKSDILNNIIQHQRCIFYHNLNDFLNEINTYPNNHLYFLDILYELILCYDESSIDIEDILKRCYSVFETDHTILMIERLNKSKLKYLREIGVFNKILDVLFSWIFKVDAQGQYKSFQKWLYNTTQARCIFQHIKYDKELLKKLDCAIGELKISRITRSNVYSVQNGNSASVLFENIINDNKQEINKVMQDENVKFPNLL